MAYQTIPTLVHKDPVGTAHMNKIKNDLDYLKTQVENAVAPDTPVGDGIDMGVVFHELIFWGF